MVDASGVQNRLTDRDPKVLVGLVVLTVALGLVGVRMLTSDGCEPVSQPLFEPTLVNGPDVAEEALADFLASPDSGDGPATGLHPNDAAVERTPTYVVFQTDNGDVTVVVDYVEPNLDEFGWYVSEVSATC